MLTLTTNEFAEKNGIDYPTARGVLEFLVSKGVVGTAGTRPNPAGKGKPSNLFNVPVGPLSLTVVPRGPGRPKKNQPSLFND